MQKDQLFFTVNSFSEGKHQTQTMIDFDSVLVIPVKRRCARSKCRAFIARRDAAIGCACERRM